MPVRSLSRAAIACLLAAIWGCTGSDAPDRGPAAPSPGTGSAKPSSPAPSAETGRQKPGPVAPAAAASRARFRDLTASSHVNHVYRNGEESRHAAILESLGGGVALLDYDRDGLLDVFAPGGGAFGKKQEILGLPSALFRNRNGWDFEAVTAEAGAGESPYYSHAAAAADYDNDGFTDVLVTGYGGLVLLHNQGDGTFASTSIAAGLDDKQWSSSAAWGDVDGDSVLDVYVAHYVNWTFDNHPFCRGPKEGDREVCPPRDFDPLPDVFYLGTGDGTFRNATQSAGLRKDGKGLAVMIADVDLDGRVDIYVCNDTVPSFLYKNSGGGKLEDVSLVSGACLSETGVANGSMGIDLGDYNLDGQPDLWVANFERESFALYRNEGNCFFQHVSQSMGVTALGGLYVGWGTVFLDFDRDGDEDLFSSNGHVIRFPVNAPVRQVPLLLENRESRRMENVTAAAGDYFQAPHMGRGLACGDIDNDGDLDAAISCINEPLALLSNETPNDNHWLCVRLIGSASNRDAVGALVRAHVGGKMQMRQVKGGTSYASTQDPRLYFGLGPATSIDRLEIRWPTGTTQTVEIPGVDQQLTLIEPATP